MDRVVRPKQVIYWSNFVTKRRTRTRTRTRKRRQNIRSS